MSLSAASRQGDQLAATGQASMQSQRLAKSVSQALVGNPAAFPEVRESSTVLVRNIKGLGAGDGELRAVTGDALQALTPLLPVVERAEKSAAELSAVGQLVMLTQRIGKSANEFLTMEGVSPEAVFLLGKDLNAFREIAEGVNNGNPELRLPGTKDAQTKERLQQLIKQYDETRAQATAILANLMQGLVAAREAHGVIVGDSEPLRRVFPPRIPWNLMP